jgi:hypothetical protein
VVVKLPKNPRGFVRCDRCAKTEPLCRSCADRVRKLIRDRRKKQAAKRPKKPAWHIEVWDGDKNAWFNKPPRHHREKTAMSRFSREYRGLAPDSRLRLLRPDKSVAASADTFFSSSNDPLNGFTASDTTGVRPIE